MRLLMLGGTRFLGRHIVECALSRGHELTLFHRGESGKQLFEGHVDRILGDRTTDLARLVRGHWDAAIDTCGFVPRVVALSAKKFAEESIAQRYLFVSSISVLDRPQAGADEDWPVGRIEDPNTEEITGESYGPLKALCEEAVLEAFPKTFLNVRPGLIVGPHDTTDRFTYWPWRMARGGDVLVPGRRDQPVQIIDVRDLAEWCVTALENRMAGTFHLTGPEQPRLLGEMLEQMKDQLNPTARLVWVDPQKLAEWGVKPWAEVPLYLGPESDSDGMMAISIRRAKENGLSLRGFEETVRDTLEWERSRPDGHEWKAGLSPERERELLDIWWS